MSRSKFTAHVLFNEEPEIVRLLDERAAQEGTDRAKLIRRAIRRELSLLPGDSTSGTVRDEEDAAQAA